MPIIKSDPNELRQLALQLDLPEPEENAGLSPEEVQRVSMAARGAFEARFDKHPDGQLDTEGAWFTDYVGLIEAGYDWRLAAYIAWEASPKSGRRPESITKLATEVMGLKSPRVIYTWRKKNPNIDNVISMMQSAPLYAHRRDVIEALVAVAKDPDYKAHKDRRLFFEMLGDYTPRQDVNVNDKSAANKNDLSTKSEEELRKMASMLEDSEAPDPPEGHEVIDDD